LPHRCIAGVSQGSSVAVLAWHTIWPDVGPRLMVALLMVSTLGALNSNVLVGPRVLFAVARDHAAFGRLARVSPRTHTPVAAIGLMCGWSILLVLLGDLSPRPGQLLADVLTNYCVFGGSIFYFLSVLAVFVLRSTRPEAPRPYRTWGYPFTPAVFVCFYVVFLVLTLLSQPVECLAGLLLVALGAAAYGVIGRQ
jgi:APA family basic amino acid/polyamine antiporter